MNRRLIAVGLVVGLMPGCHDLHNNNTATQFGPPRTRPDPSITESFLNRNYLYPGRDWLTLTWLGRALFGDEAWNVRPDGSVADSAFFTKRDILSVSPKSLRAGRQSTASGGPPQLPWSVHQAKARGATDGFIGRDATGRRFMLKFDHTDFPELGTASEIIASRLYWLVGYNVPVVYLTTVSGTGDARFDWRRAAAVEFVSGELFGSFRMDHFRLRREMRAMRVLCAWIHETDRSDRNTIVSVQCDFATFYLLDFNSALGSWNGRPKPVWSGWRYVWDVEWQILTLLTLGLARPGYDPAEPVVSPAVGRFSSHFDPWNWRSENPLTPFDRMTRNDAAWMLEKIMQISVEQLRAIVAAGEYSRAEDAEYVLETLLARRERLRAFVE
jgi:hypothetical protein